MARGLKQMPPGALALGEGIGHRPCSAPEALHDETTLHDLYDDVTKGTSKIHQWAGPDVLDEIREWIWLTYGRQIQ
jgi:hypothetical protein